PAAARPRQGRSSHARFPSLSARRPVRLACRKNQTRPDRDTDMTELEQLERSIADAIGAASDEAAIEAVRVAALGKKGSVSEKLKSLGAMTPEERQQMGPAINGLKERVTQALG